MKRAELIKELNKPLDHNRVRKFSKDAGSKSGLSYLEGHDVIRELNIVFGFSWSHSIKELELIEAGPVKTRNGKEMYSAMYRCIVEIQGGCEDFYASHQGVGFGSSFMGEFNKSDVHEVAMKEAETDAIKRAAMKFGDRFGLALYDKEQVNVTRPRDINAEKLALLQAAQKTHGISVAQASEMIVYHMTLITNRSDSTYADLSEEEAAYLFEAVTTPIKKDSK